MNEVFQGLPQLHLNGSSLGVFSRFVAQVRRRKRKKEEKIIRGSDTGVRAKSAAAKKFSRVSLSVVQQHPHEHLARHPGRVTEITSTDDNTEGTVRVSQYIDLREGAAVRAAEMDAGRKGSGQGAHSEPVQRLRSLEASGIKPRKGQPDLPFPSSLTVPQPGVVS